MADHVNVEVPGQAHPVQRSVMRECGLCRNPYPYMCVDCRDTGDEEAKRSINSGGMPLPSNFLYV
jgi:hypothetical protein